MRNDPFEDFDRTTNKIIGLGVVLGALWMLFWIGVVVMVLVLLWRNFA